MRMGTWVVALALAGAVVFALLAGPRTPAPIGEGQQAPAFRLAREGSAEAVSLASLDGRVVLLNFWATWCIPCEEEMPAMERLYRALRGPDFELVAVSVDEDPATVKAFRERLGLSFPILLDPRREAAAIFQTYRFPETFLIDRSGRIVSRFVGPREWDAPVYLERIRDLIRAGAPAS